MLISIGNTINKVITAKSKTVIWIFSSFLTILLLAATRLMTYAQPVTYEINTIPLKGDLINFTGLSILQDRDGFMWFGSEDGLYRYHGSGVKIYRNLPEDSISLQDDRIHELYEDSDGVIWIGSECGLHSFDKNTETFIRYKQANHKITDFVEDKDGYLWFAVYGGFTRFDRITGNVKNYTIGWGHSSQNEIPYHVNDLYYDREGYMWVSGIHDLRRFNIESESYEIISDDFQTTGFCEDRTGRFWIAGSKGLYSFDRENLTLKKFLYNPGNPNSLKDLRIRAMLEDESGNLWIRTYDGIYCYNQDLELKFHWEHALPYTHTYTYRYLTRPMMEDNTGAIWFYSTEGIHQIVKKSGNFRKYDSDPILQNIIDCIFLESNNYIWIGNQYGLFCLDLRNNTVKQHYGNLSDGSYPYEINRIYKDLEGTVWLGTNYQELLSITKSDESVIRFEKHMQDTSDTSNKSIINLTNINHLYEDSQGRLWIGAGGNKSICYYNRKVKKYINLVDNPSAENKLPDWTPIRHETESNILWATGWMGVYKILPPFIRLSENEVMASQVIQCQAVGKDGTIRNIPSARTSYMDSTGNIWLGTHSEGLVRLTKQEHQGSTGNEFDIEIYNTDHGLAANLIQSILDDCKGNLWLGTIHGLSKFNRQSETFTNYYVRHGLSHNFFRHESASIGTEGDLFFGTSKGMISFYPDSIKINEFVSPVMLTDFKIQNVSILPGANSILKKSITFTDTIELEYNQDHLSFEFAILNYRDPELNQYKYMLEGFDPQWVYSGHRNYALYSNLRPGNYVFRVTGANNDGIWNEEGTSLHITIHPPPWKTWYAYLVYGFILTGIILWYRRFLQNKAKLRLAVEVGKIEKEKVLEMDQMKSRFFANISHEFRTPLTLILGPLEKLDTKKSGNISFSRDLVASMRRNASRLLRLINQLLDISKLETGKITLQVSEGDLEAFVKAILLSFLSLAESKKIRYIHDLPGTSRKVYFDRDKVEKILTNLISNAFKYTPSKGEVSVCLKYDTKTEFHTTQLAEIKIKDTGQGIPTDKLDKIFDRFFKVSDSYTSEKEGIGIGLALTKELVDLYRGEIRVESEVGRGSVFRIRLPFLKEQFSEEEIIAVIPGEEASKEPVEPGIEHGEPVLAEITEGRDGKYVKGIPVILVVEDNIDLRNYISGNLGDSYQILVAENGEQGLERAAESIPDLIISDVMMPVMDGMEMCSKLKKDERTNHIPVIMLTARADRGSKMEGLETGVDDYIIKPFDAKELQVRVRNLIDQRKKLRERVRKEFLTDPAGYEFPAPEDEFMIRVLDCMKQHLTDSAFNVEQMGKKLRLSRTQLYRKILAVTDHTPSELIRNTRLKMAARMFREGHKNVTRVMLSVGFDTSVNFAQYFRELFGLNPSEYIKTKAPSKK